MNQNEARQGNHGSPDVAESGLSYAPSASLLLCVLSLSACVPGKPLQLGVRGTNCAAGYVTLFP